MRAARAAGAMVNVHCENSDMLDLAQADLVAAGRTDPRHYAASRPALAEVEATRRVIDYAELVDAEVYIVHMSCSGAAEAVRAARRRGPARVGRDAPDLPRASPTRRTRRAGWRRRRSAARRRSAPRPI